MSNDVFKPQTCPNWMCPSDVQKRRTFVSISFVKAKSKSYRHASQRSPVKFDANGASGTARRTKFPNRVTLKIGNTTLFVSIAAFFREELIRAAGEFGDHDDELARAYRFGNVHLITGGEGQFAIFFACVSSQCRGRRGAAFIVRQ